MGWDRVNLKKPERVLPAQVRKTHMCQVTTEGRGPWEHTIPSVQKSKIQPPAHCCWRCKVVHPLRKTVYGGCSKKRSWNDHMKQQGHFGV